ncbi:MAG TPA: DUF3048 C-terminal domain-containing protein [Frankiaceae bacterium]|nr:DUF3048 C-terminal domain-containing protein [Frankiaceae bacterium]
MSVRATTVGAALAMLGCLAAGCAGGSSASISNPPSSSLPTTSAPSVTPKPTVTPAAPVATLPLTGLGTTSKAMAAQRVMAAALSASYGQTQPTGASLAETVYVEYSDTVRMLALYQSVAAAAIGPIAQTRPVDGPILGFLHPGYANAGGPVGFVTTLDQSAVSDLSTTADPSAYTAGASGQMTSTAALRKSTATTPAAPPLFTFGSPDAPLAKTAKTAHTVTVSVAGFPAVTWNYDAKSGRWHTTDQVMSAGSPTSLVFQQVSYKTVQLHHPDGAIVPSARVFGSGVATVLSGPSAITGVWTKPGDVAVTVYADSTGVPLSFRPGVTWVLLIPSGTQVTYK